MSSFLSTDWVSTVTPTAGPPSTLYENFGAAFSEEYRVNSTFSLQAEAQILWEDSVRAYDRRTGRASGAATDENTTAFLLNGLLNEEGQNTLGQSLLGGNLSNDSIDAFSRTSRASASKTNAEIAALNDPEILSIDRILAQLIEKRKETSGDLSQAEATGGYGSTLARLAGSIAGSLTTRSPLQLASLAIPGAEGYGIATKLATEVAVNAAVAGATTAYDTNPLHSALGEPTQSVAQIGRAHV